jgi:hypothetical protein
LTFKRFHLAELEKNSAENASNFTRLTWKQSKFRLKFNDLTQKTANF